MSASKLKTEEIMRLAGTLQGMATLVFDSVELSMKTAQAVKDKVDLIEKDIDTGRFKRTSCSGSMYMQMLEITAQASEKYKGMFSFARKKLEEEFRSENPMPDKISTAAHKMFDIFYEAYGQHFGKLQNMQISVVSSLATMMSEGVKTLAEFGVIDEIDRGVSELKKQQTNIVSENKSLSENIETPMNPNPNPKEILERKNLMIKKSSSANRRIIEENTETEF